jgi:subtilisin family serine protease
MLDPRCPVTRHSRVVPVVAAGVCLAFLVNACGGDSPSEPSGGQPTVRVARVDITPTAGTLAALGDTIRFQAQAFTAQGSAVTGVSFTWSSANDQVATVTSTGLVTAVTNGATEIRAQAQQVTGTAALTVDQVGAALVVRTQPGGARAGLPLDIQPVLEIVDGKGVPVPTDSSTALTATIISGSGTLEVAVATASGGVITFTDVTIAGPAGSYVLTFSAEGLPALNSDSFELEPGLPATLAVESGDAATGLADTELAVAVRVADSYDNGVPGVTVMWAVVEGDGSLAAGEAQTDQTGIAGVDYRLGRFAGTETLAGSVAGLDGSPATFSLTATPNATISGTVSLSNQLMSASLSQQTGSGGGGGLVRPGGARVSKPPLSLQSGFDADVAPSGTGIGRAPAKGPEFVPGELLVTFRADVLGAPQVGSLAYRSETTARTVGAAMRAALAASESTDDLVVLGASPAILGARVRVRNDASIEAVARALRRNPRVAHVERHRIVYALRNEAPVSSSHPPNHVQSNDPLYAWQAWHYHMIDLPRAWRVTTGTASVVVAVVDDGIRLDHPDIAANLTSDGYDFVANNDVYPICSGGSLGRAGDGDGYDPDPTIPWAVTWDGIWGCIDGLKDSGGHGLHVAGTIGAAGNDGIGVTGVNWNVSIRPVRVLDIRGIGNIYDIAQGILYSAGLQADDGAGGTVAAPSAAHIINMSLGGPGNSVMQENAVAAAAQAGSLLIAAAGNDGSAEPRYPAAYPEVISVSAVAPDRSLASYSSFGSTIDVAAPGGDVSSGCSFGVYSTTWNFVAGEPNHGCEQGTSMAAPHVAGVAALLLAAEPGLSATQLRARLLDYAVPAGPSDQYGAGIVNARNSLTRTFAPAQALHARLIDAGTGATITTVSSPSGSYAFTELVDGDYYVYAGQDEEGDGIIGIPVRRWGARGGTAKPSLLAVSGAGEYPASFQLGFPIEGDPNGTLADADYLPINGYLLGRILDPDNEVDVMRVIIPTAGHYVFETSAVAGACGFAYEEDTVLGLYNADGELITFNEDVDAGALNFCSRISEMLDPGVYYLGVFGLRSGRYAVRVREGS